jgi:hypothetical protein
MVSLTDGAASAQLDELLENALAELGRLCDGTNRLRASKLWMSRGVLAFSPSALDRLCAVIRDGCRALAVRMGELQPAASAPMAADTAAREKIPAGAVTMAVDPASLLVAYRACGRALCAALVEARRIADAHTAAVLAGVVHRLEKQLWLLDAPRSRERVGLPTIHLFLSC